MEKRQRNELILVCERIEACLSLQAGVDAAFAPGITALCLVGPPCQKHARARSVHQQRPRQTKPEPGTDLCIGTGYDYLFKAHSPRSEYRSVPMEVACDGVMQASTEAIVC